MERLSSGNVSPVPLYGRLVSFVLSLRVKSSEPQRKTYTQNHDGTPNVLSTEHVTKDEKTLLRQRSLTQMAPIEPEWIQEFKSSTQRRISIWRWKTVISW